VISSSSRRCWTTVAPFTDVAGVDLEVTRRLSEEDGSPRSVSATVARLLERKESAVLCTHRPLLPWVWEALALEERKLAPGAMVVAHHRRDRVVAVEHHRVLED
jgi:8-oxo-dGTP diphosphatase